MKKLLFAIAILFAVNGKAQDTTYLMKRNKFYMEVRQQIEVTNPTDQQAILIKERQKIRKRNRVTTIVCGTIFSAISVWFWSGYHR